MEGRGSKVGRERTVYAGPVGIPGVPGGGFTIPIQTESEESFSQTPDIKCERHFECVPSSE